MDEIERMLRASRPQIGSRQDPLTARARRDLDDILGGRGPAPARRRDRPLRLAGLAVALAMLTTIATLFAVFQAPQPSFAAPPPLELRPTTESLPDLMTRLSLQARSIESPEPGTVAYEAWFSTVVVDESATSHFVQPVEVTQERHDDFSGTLTTRAGSVRWGTPSKTNPAQAPGAVLDESTFAAGEFPAIYRDPPPADPSEYPRYFTSAGWDPASTTGDWFKAVEELAKEWALDGAQTSALIDYIATLPDISVAGRTVDRLGRNGIAIQTRTRLDGAFIDTLVFDEAAGRLLSAEETYLGGVEGIDLPSPVVFSYIAWKEIS